MIELLSPAGTSESFYASISNGCDAIYLGIDKFNARAYATNFTIPNLEVLIKFAHLRNVKIYVTMNTVLYDEELEEAFKTVDELARIKVDAIIVQDLALLNYITDNYISIKAHASTQMGIDDIEGAKFLKSLGVTRIVFARETRLSTLKEIKEKLEIEIEAFIHGALCVSYSGNCLMSSMIGDRSGNRGRCAGCCRQKYLLIDVDKDEVIKNGFLLSMKDLNVSTHLKDMDFIDSLKIEGRMKEPTYVAGVTNYYRHLLDHEQVDASDINKVFNRTYTKGFMLDDTSSDITNIERPNNFGYLIGKVVKINKDTIWIRLDKELNKGDQIRIESKNILEEISLPIIRLFDANFKEVETTNKIAIVSCHKEVALGAKVYKTKDVKYYKKVEETLRNKEYKKIDIDFKFVGRINQPLSLTVTYNDISITDTLDFIVEKSIKSITTKENIYKQLSKLNDTPYSLNNLTVDMDSNAFIPLKLLNELRRSVIEKLNERRLNSIVESKKPTEIAVKEHTLTAPKISVEVATSEQYEIAKELGIETIYFKNVVRRNNSKYVDKVDTVLAGGLGALSYYKDKDVTLVSDTSFNVTNYKTCALLSSYGVNRITLSLEINKDHINTLVDNYFNTYHTYPNLELVVYGRSKLMHTKYCPLKRLNMCGKCKTNHYVLKDRFERFPLMFNSDCTVNLLNSKTLNLMDDLNKVKGISYYRLSFTNETASQTRRIIETFMKILSGEKIKTFDERKDTRGHFFKNPL